MNGVMSSEVISGFQAKTLKADILSASQTLDAYRNENGEYQVQNFVDEDRLASEHEKRAQRRLKEELAKIYKPRVIKPIGAQSLEERFNQMIKDIEERKVPPRRQPPAKDWS